MISPHHVAPDAQTRPEAHAAFMGAWEADMERLDETIRPAYDDREEEARIRELTAAP